jgi:hypothetical protein
MMTAKIRILPKTAAIGVAALLATIPVRVNAQQNSDQAPRIGGTTAFKAQIAAAVDLPTWRPQQPAPGRETRSRCAGTRSI